MQRVFLALTALAFLLPGSGPARADNQVVAAFFLDYQPDVQTVRQGDTLTFLNSDPFGLRGHTFTHNTRPGVAPLFDSDVVMPGQSVQVRGVEKLPLGDYPVACRVHPEMHGGLVVGRNSVKSPLDLVPPPPI